MAKSTSEPPNGEIDESSGAGLVALFARSYEALRGRLIKYFYYKGVANAADRESLADRVLFIVARALTNGLIAPSLEAYAYGVASKVAKEYHRRRQGEELDETQPGTEPGYLPRGYSSLEAQTLLEQCRGAVTEEEYALWWEYHHGDRHQLAIMLNVTANALTIRAHRIEKRMIRFGRGKNLK